MTTQANPPTEAQQLHDARTATKNAQDLADHYRRVLDAERAGTDGLATANLTLWRLLKAEQVKNARLDRQNDEEHEMVRHEASEARIGAQAARNAMYHAIMREREANDRADKARRWARVWKGTSHWLRAHVSAANKTIARLAKSVGNLEHRHYTAMLQIRDAHNALHQAEVPSEPHEPHDGCQTQLGHRVRALAGELSAAERRLGEAYATLALIQERPTTPLWDETRCRVCGWPIKERIEDGCTRESCSQRPLPSPRADAGYVSEAVQALLTDHAPAALLPAALLAAAEGVVAVGYTEGIVMVDRAAFERLKGLTREDRVQ